MGAFSRLAGMTLLVGGGAIVVGALVLGPRLVRAARPELREALKIGLSGYDCARRAAAEMIEDFEDLAAEVRAELHPSHGAADEDADPFKDGVVRE